MIEDNVIMVGMVVGWMMWDRMLRHRIEMSQLRYDNQPETIEKIVEVEKVVEVEKPLKKKIMKEVTESLVLDSLK